MLLVQGKATPQPHLTVICGLTSTCSDAGLSYVFVSSVMEAALYFLRVSLMPLHRLLAVYFVLSINRVDSQITN